MNISNFIKNELLINYKGVPYYIKIVKGNINTFPNGINFTLPLLFSDNWICLNTSAPIGVGKGFYKQVINNTVLT